LPKQKGERKAVNNKEVREIKRRFQPNKNNITHIYGCYVNGGTKEVISSFTEPVALLEEQEQKQYFALLNKALSGGMGKNLMDVSFTTAQVKDSDEHRLLSRLRQSKLEDEAARDKLCQILTEALNFEDKNYLILMAYDAYDVKAEKEDMDSADVFRYFLCCVCPVTTGRAELGYAHKDKRFHNEVISQLVTAPVLGFMYPAFDDRCTNIYGALLYSRNAAENHTAFVASIFNRPAPMTAVEQKDCFDELLSDALDSRCGFELVQNLNQQICDKIAAHKESGSPEVLTFSGYEVGEMLEEGGTPAEQVDAFVHSYEERIGKDAEIVSTNICNPRKMTVETEQIKISLDPQYSYLIQTRNENGRKYIIIAADSGVEINGVPVEIT